MEIVEEIFRVFARHGADAYFGEPVSQLERLGWRHAGLLDATVASDEVPQGRPAPDMICRAMELTGVTDASRVVKVGDTPSDLQEGQAAGCGWIVGVTAGSHTREQLCVHPHTHLLPAITDLLPLLLPQ